MALNQATDQRKGNGPQKPGTPPAAGTTKPAARATRTPVERKPLDFSQIQVTQITNPSTMAKARPAKKERTAEQKQIDTIVERAWEAWKNSGRPTAWAKMQGMKLRVPADQLSTLQYRIRQAGTFFDCKIRFGAVKEADGYAEVVFVAMDRPVKKTDTPAPAVPTAEQAVNGTGQTEA